MKRACVIGWPVEHSRSPLIHGHWLRTHGIAGSYGKEAVPPAELDAFLASLAARGFAGCNVTVPHKEGAYRFCAARGGVLHPDAKVVGVANTLWLDADGRLNATSTDAYGFMTHLRSSVPGFDLTGRTVMVLGAGGAAQSVVWALVATGVGEVRVANRSPDRVDELKRGQPSAPVRAIPWQDRSLALADCDLLVNATTLGMRGQPGLEIDLARLPDRAVVYDIVYVPLETRLLAAARGRGLRVVDGLGMLLHQAVPGFEKWFGVRPEVTPELRALLVRDIEAS